MSSTLRIRVDDGSGEWFLTLDDAMIDRAGRTLLGDATWDDPSEQRQWINDVRLMLNVALRPGGRS